MHIKGKRHGERLFPLQEVTLDGVQEGIISVKDGAGREYLREVARPEMSFRIGGTLGKQLITRENAMGQILERLLVEVDASTTISDQGGQFSELLQLLLYTMLTQSNPDWAETAYVRYEGRIYHFFVRWLRDHVHVLKGMKYFSPELKDGIDLYRNSQRADGMIWDNVYPRNGHPNYWDVRFTEGNFIHPFADGSSEFKRIPVETDVEYLFVEGLYYTWKATGDDGWMADSLDAAIRALEYSVHDSYRWSEKYQLIKRGYTIDTWDFQTEEDSAILHDAMRIDPERTHFGIMFGDNTGYIAACSYLALILEHMGRTAEATHYRQRAEAMRERLNALSWNGRHFTHHVPEHPERIRDLGVVEASQVSLSNAYSLNRGLTQEQCAAIIETYQRLREELPEGSPGEWYSTLR